jgi:hypothetical protein
LGVKETENIYWQMLLQECVLEMERKKSEVLISYVPFERNIA